MASERVIRIVGVAAALAAPVVAAVVIGVIWADHLRAATPATPEIDQGAVSALAIGTVERISRPDQISLPIDDFRPDAASENLVLSAEHALTGACMERFGMSLNVPVWSVPDQHHDYDRLFGVLSMDEAEAFGYHLPGESPAASGLGSARPNANPEEVKPGYIEVFMGDADELNGITIPDGGCIGEARTTLGDDGELRALIEEAINHGLAQSDLDPRVGAAFAAWSACMANAGYQYGRPADPINDPRWNTETATATPAEIGVAVADVQCKIETDLTGLRVAVAAAWQQEFIKEHAAELRAAVAAFEQQRRAAEAAL